MKILASDYDGTLNHGGIDKEKCCAIAKWQEEGNLFGIVSGRGIYALKRLVSGNNNKNILHEENINGIYKCDFLIANNGAVISKGDGTVLTDTKAGSDIIIPLIKLLFEENCPLACVCGCDYDEFFVKPSQELCQPDEYLIETMPQVTYFNQISTILDTSEEAFFVIEKIKEKFSDVLNPLQNGRCIDIVPKNVNKAQGLYDFIKTIGAKKEDVITIGDNINDADMIREFYSYAMENGVDEIKRLANKQTKSVTQLIKDEI